MELAICLSAGQGNRTQLSTRRKNPVDLGRVSLEEGVMAGKRYWKAWFTHRCSVGVLEERRSSPWEFVGLLG